MSTADKSPNAFARYRELVAESNQTPFRLCEKTDLTDAELWWCDLTALEAWVFGIDPALCNALLLAHIRYQDMIGCTDLEFEEFRDEDRAAFAEHFRGECIYSFEAAVGFMVAACEMPFEQSLMWVCRVLAQNVRSGLYFPKDEAPDWALGPVDPQGLFDDPSSWHLETARGF